MNVKQWEQLSPKCASQNKKALVSRNGKNVIYHPRSLVIGNWKPHKLLQRLKNA